MISERDYSEVVIKLSQLLRDWHNASLKKEFVDCQDISVDITDLAQQLEDMSAKLANDQRAEKTL